MDVQKISNNVRMQKWMTIIDECSKSELSVKAWCRQNDISEQSYYYVANRGWNNQKIADAINSPYKVIDSVNNFTGNPAKVYFINDTHYVVIDSVTNKVVQVSDLTKKYWKFTPGDFTK